MFQATRHCKRQHQRCARPVGLHYPTDTPPRAAPAARDAPGAAASGRGVASPADTDRPRWARRRDGRAQGWGRRTHLHRRSAAAPPPLGVGKAGPGRAHAPLAGERSMAVPGLGRPARRRRWEAGTRCNISYRFPRHRLLPSRRRCLASWGRFPGCVSSGVG